ncbi:MAG: Cysteine-rich secretory protein family protein [Pelotomaculum sp. PtaB.Bin104]|nr:MAG: Cysteine-rich secretory protein family protein [Pelotomaculum sp. PtaB.Bin104]
MIKNKKLISLLLTCTLLITASFLMLNSLKAEAATNCYQNYFSVLKSNYQYLDSYGSFPNYNLTYNWRSYPFLRQKLEPTVPTAPTIPTTPTTPTIPATPTAPTAPTTGLTAEEQQMVDLVNQERVKAGLQKLEVDLRLVKVARMKSQDMIDNNYFSHQSPTYGSPFDMMKSQGITYSYAGENLAGNQSVQAAHTALMNSSGHRANILNPNFNRLGIGIVQGGPYGMMFTQEFTD